MTRLGIAVIDNGQMQIIKEAARSANWKTRSEYGNSRNAGHRAYPLATHGVPNETNAHPHSDSNGKIALIHNELSRITVPCAPSCLEKWA